MKNTKQELDIISLLDGNANLRRDWLQPPQVAHIPFMRSRKAFFLLVNVQVMPEAKRREGREKLVAGCFAAVQSVIGSGLLTNEKAVEISAFVEVSGQQNLRRCFRLGVCDTAFTQAMQIKAIDLLNKEYVGIICQWPLQEIL